MKNLRSVGLIIIALGLLITLGIMISTTSPIGSLSDFLFTLGFYAWVALPFVVLIAVTFYIHRKGLSRPARISILVTSILVVVSSVLVYWASIFNSESSTSALAFIFIPFYALVASAVVHVLAWLLLRLFMTKSKV